MTKKSAKKAKEKPMTVLSEKVGKPIEEGFLDDEVPQGQRIEWWPLLKCLGIAHEKNPKEHDIDQLVASIRRFGFTSPPLIDESTGVMVAGHGRCEALEAMLKLGEKVPKLIRRTPNGEWLVPVIRGVSFDSEAERDAYVVADNQHVINGGWKFDVLGELLHDIGKGAMGFDGLGFEQVELDNLLGNYRPDDAPPGGFDPEDRPPPDDDDNKGRTQITARIECPKCGHMIER